MQDPIDKLEAEVPQLRHVWKICQNHIQQKQVFSPSRLHMISEMKLSEMNITDYAIRYNMLAFLI